jgi:hypothetical protein
VNSNQDLIYEGKLKIFCFIKMLLTIHSCRICKSKQMYTVVDLGYQYLTSRFPKLNDPNTPIAPMVLTKCTNCGLVQLRDSLNSNEMYENQYGYRSGISNTMRNHLLKYNEEIRSKVNIQDNDHILDIGCNDGTMLRFFPDGKKVGIDPTAIQFSSYHEGLEIIPNYFTFQNLYEKIDSSIKFKVISSISMFYDLPDPAQFAKDVARCLDDEGLWTLEQSYIGTMIERNSFDTICHEHLEYYALKQIVYIANMADLKIIDVEFNDCNGGSFRLYMAKKNSQYKECTARINEILVKEMYLDDLNTYFDFMKKCNNEMDKLKLFIETIHKNGKRIYIYGASTKGNTLLQYIDASNQIIPFAVERNLDKVGRMTPGTNIEIISEETMRKNAPEYLIVLPWHFREEIIQREDEYLNKGGQLIFPLPKFDIVSKKENVLITGIDGQIGCEIKKNI